MPRPAKRAKLDALSDNDTEEAIAPTSFTINADFAARFEHNKKREEKARLEEKYGSISLPSTKQQEEEEDEESSDESEDDDAELVDLEVDKEISATLEALRRKDPRIYDEGVKFYKDWEGGAQVDGGGKKKEEKPMYLHDYHRRNLLEGHAGGEEEEEEQEEGVETYQQEQDALKERLVGSMHDAVPGSSGSDNDEEDGFLVKKTKQPKHATLPTTTTTAAKRITESDIASASHDPETYLSNFMAARAWIAPTSSNSPYAALDEDDSEEDSRADKFEEAFNLRFEDPNKANEVLMSFQRDAGKNGVRRDEVTGRKKAREREKERKVAERLEREQERARLRKLMVEEAEAKVRRIKEAAGLRGRDVDLAQWRDVIEGDFEDDQWDLEMKRRFGEEYYDEAEGGSEEDDGKRKVKKPKWEDDIDIKDLIPEFEDEEEGKQKPDFSLSDEEEEEENDAIGGVPIEEDGMDLDDETPAPTTTSSARKTKKSREQDKLASKRAARSQRAALESLVDAQLPIAHPSIAPSLNPKKSTNLASNITSSKNTVSGAGGFRYRQASPTFFGLTAKDVLFAEDAQLNEYVGLKKMHSFRDGEKKRRDKKRLGKKARLREWRKATFGSVEGPSQQYVGAEGDGGEGGEGVDVHVGRGGGGGKRKRDGDGEVGGGRGGGEVGEEGGVGEEGDVREGERRKKRKRSGKGKKSGANAVEI
ncbi:Kinetochore protein Spc24 [Elasticomyces elasticus]|nr:Kinetochore protein Spc24 [Elasticomyces elasticus]KAK4973631.1 Kinetochore protein Spc24 [Elasticomyces elasticus]